MGSQLAIFDNRIIPRPGKEHFAVKQSLLANKHIPAVTTTKTEGALKAREQHNAVTDTSRIAMSRRGVLDEQEAEPCQKEQETHPHKAVACGHCDFVPPPSWETANWVTHARLVSREAEGY
jgi:hypothetical protein